MSVPSNVRRFEALLYASLMLDAVSVAVQDRTPNGETTEQMIMTSTLLAGGMILLLVYFVRLAARGRKNWPRWVLAAALVLSVISLLQVISAALQDASLLYVVPDGTASVTTNPVFSALPELVTVSV